MTDPLKSFAKLKWTRRIRDTWLKSAKIRLNKRARLEIFGSDQAILNTNIVSYQPFHCSTEFYVSNDYPAGKTASSQSQVFCNSFIPVSFPCIWLHQSSSSAVTSIPFPAQGKHLWYCEPPGFAMNQRSEWNLKLFYLMSTILLVTICKRSILPTIAFLFPFLN